MSDFDFARSLYAITDANPVPPGLLAVAADPNSFRRPLFKLSGCHSNGPLPEAQAEYESLPGQMPAAPLDYDVSSLEPISAAFEKFAPRADDGREGMVGTVYSTPFVLYRDGRALVKTLMDDPSPLE